MKPAAALLDIVLALALLLVSSVAAAWVASAMAPAFRVPVIVIGQGVLMLAIVAGILVRRRQPWGAVAMAPPSAKDGPRSLLALAGCLAINLLFIQVLYALAPQMVESHAQRLGGFAQQLAGGLPLPVLVLILGFVGVYEEIFARGLLLQRCRELAGGTWVPVLASSVLFGLGHLYQGWIGVGQTTLIGIVLALAVVRWGTLWPAIVAHALLDVSSILFMGDGQ